MFLLILFFSVSLSILTDNMKILPVRQYSFSGLYTSGKVNLCRNLKPEECTNE